MTNQSSDTQPALRPLNVSVRGGRLTKFKGQVASIAPGLSVVATAAVLFVGGATQGMAQQARDACGAPNNGVAACAAGTNYANGITYDGVQGGFTLILDDVDTRVGGEGVFVQGSSSDAGNISVRLDSGKVTADALDGFAPGLYGKIKNASSEAAVVVRVGVEGREHADAITGDTITQINTRGKGAHGLLASHNGNGNATALVVGGSVTTSTTGNEDITVGLWANVLGAGNTATAAARVTEGGEVRTTGGRGHGLYALNDGNGNATAELVDSTVTTTGFVGHGLYALLRNENSDSEIATAMARMSGEEAEVRTFENHAVGLLAKADGLGGKAAVQMNGGEISTEGAHSRGMYAYVANSASTDTATATALMTAGHIKTGGFRGHGIEVLTEGLGASSTKMEGGTITTTGDHAYGIFTGLDNATNQGTATLEMTGGTVTTTGQDAHGLFANGQTMGQAKVILGEGAIVEVHGAGANGIRTQSGSGSFDVEVAGSVTGGDVAATKEVGVTNGAAIQTLSSGGGTIDITSTARVTAGDSGIAIQDGNGVEDTTLDSYFTSDTVITSAGTVTGTVLLGTGNDVLNLEGGTFTGDIYGGTGNDTVTISAATIYDFSHVLDGGAGDNDQLVLQGQQGEKSITTTADRFLNWQGITLNNTTLSLDRAGMLDAGLSIDGRSAFRATGGDGGLTIRGDVTNNAGDVFLSVQNGETGDEIRIEGDYTGSDMGSDVFALDMGRDADGLRTDTVVITGDTSGEMTLLIAGMDSADLEGAPLVMDVVTVGGEANGTFTLVGGNYVTSDGEHAMISGAHLYKLAETDQGLALSARSESGEISWGPSAPIYDSYGASLLAFNAPSGLHARGSSQDFRDLAWSGQAAQTSGSPLWVQMGTEQITSAAEQSTTGAARDSSLWEMEIGADIVLDTSTAGLLVGGLMLSYGTGSTDVSSDFGDGSIETTGLGLGLAATWYDRRGFYVDGQVTVSSYTSDLTADRLGSLTEGNSGTGFALSIEAGQQLDFGARLTVIPQAQLSLSSVTFSDFANEARGERVTLEDAVSQQLRLGLEFGAQDQGASGVYGMVNLYHDFGSGSEVRVGPASLTSENEAWALGFGIGGSYAWNDRVDLFGEASYATGLSNAGDVSALSASAGIKVMF
ncbi:autotransporter outer membrane beta-barrel domain-containing protein [uncultured Tateyamaria sp.]|uniref:autotransporter outer membrane beta-barrel domain-containing protein n=1 Tax=uncultured Tateyamaria sp. TaxID=455651 RepID=UPI0026192B5A|nr:autotransporter outer membrane beta-barrel domain-containing protein [uncultured Tateyamaria sp.]